jgi:hypothetical protein
MRAQQRIIDQDHRCNYSQIPHRLLDDVTAGRLKATSLVLYLHYKRISWALHGGPVTEALRETQKASGLSQGTILSSRKELAAAGWAIVDEAPRVATVTLVERWAENCPGHDAQNLSKQTTEATPDAQKLSKDAQNLSDFAQNLSDFAQNLSKSELEPGPIESEDIEDVPEESGARAPGPESRPKKPASLATGAPGDVTVAPRDNRVTDAFVAELVAQYGPQLGGGARVRLAISKAQNAAGFAKTLNPRTYVRNWLAEDVLKRPDTRNGARPKVVATDDIEQMVRSKSAASNMDQRIGRSAS